MVLSTVNRGPPAYSKVHQGLELLPLRHKTEILLGHWKPYLAAGDDEDDIETVLTGKKTLDTI